MTATDPFSSCPPTSSAEFAGTVLETSAERAARSEVAMVEHDGAVWPPGCNGDGTPAPAGERGRTGCLHHYPPGRNLAAEGCICPAWFDGGGWHLTDRNEACRAHLTVTAGKEG